jgi:hypothetical protein
MYTRNYFDGGEVDMPRGYDGIALRAEDSTELDETTPVAVTQTSSKTDGKGAGILSGILGNLHLGIPSLDKIGYEEILIIGIAAFLFFSADGDRECALILLALLLIN